jgi:hypothetical protein
MIRREKPKKLGEKTVIMPGVCCTELLVLFWTLSIVLYVKDKRLALSNGPN